MHQSTTPSLSQTIWPRWASRQFIVLPIVQTLLPVTLVIPLAHKAIAMWQLRSWKKLWWRSLTRSQKDFHWGLPEVVGTVQQVHYSRRRLLRRGLEFHMSLNKIYIYIYKYIYIYIYMSINKYIYIYIYHQHHHVTLVARVSLTLSRHSSLSFIALGRSSGQHPVSSHNCWMYVCAGRPAFARPCVGVHKSTSLMSSSLLL